MRAQPVIDRRGFLWMASAAAGAVLLAGCAPSPRNATPAPAAPVAAGAGGTLRIPPLAPSRMDGATRVFSLTAQVGRTALTSGGDTETWGFNGAFLGPTIRVSRGEQVRMEVRNDLREPTSVHWHGMHLPAAADGGPHQMIPPGRTWTPSWHVDQPAATLWYHPHPHGRTEAHVYLGLSGLLIVDEDDEALGLPSAYGIDDIPLIVQDKEFDADGRMVDTERTGPGMLGSTLLVNGVSDATLTVAAELTRFRILNGSTARSYEFGFSDDRSFDLIATDGGYLDGSVPTTRVRLTPGERAEILLRTMPSETVVLKSFAHDLGDTYGETGSDVEWDILTITAPEQPTTSPVLATALGTIARLSEADATVTRRFEMHADRINDEPMDMARIDEVVTVDTVEIWEVVNTTRTPHNFHIHDVQFQVLSIGGTAPPPDLGGAKDTVYLPPNVPVRLIMQFRDHADPSIPYMYHCHMLWHEDIGMMGQFVVVHPGQTAGTVPASPGHSH